MGDMSVVEGLLESHRQVTGLGGSLALDVLGDISASLGIGQRLMERTLFGYEGGALPLAFLQLSAGGAQQSLGGDVAGFGKGVSGGGGSGGGLQASLVGGGELVDSAQADVDVAMKIPYGSRGGVGVVKDGRTRGGGKVGIGAAGQAARVIVARKTTISAGRRGGSRSSGVGRSRSRRGRRSGRRWRC
jgi:hypothetical protein